jgi:spermidine synthase
MDADATILLQQTIADGSTIRIWQQDEQRYLDFDDGLVQSAIDLQHPDYLPLPLNRAMLAGIVFCSPIQRVLLAGTGGGATARFLAQQFPQVQGEAVEVSAELADLARQYFDFPASWPIHIEAIEDYLTQPEATFDLILLDIAVEQRTPQWLLNSDFLQKCRNHLTATGHLAINLLVDDAEGFLAALKSIRQIFERRTVCLSLENHRNIVVFAFNAMPAFLPPLSTEYLRSLEQDWSIEFMAFYERMLKENPAGSGIF